MYELFIGNKNYSSWSLRPWVLMRECGIPFEERIMPFPEGGSYDTFRNFSPTGKVPCLKDGETVVWDSLGIAEYLAERHRRVWPEDAQARAWARCAAAEMHSGFTALRSACPMSCGIRVRPNPMTDALKQDIARISELWNEGLSRFGGPFLAGANFTAVDAFFAPVAFRVQSYGLQLGGQAMAYVARLLALPAMRSWYEAGLAETWREPDHEREAAEAGTLLQDLRAKPAA
ncbi:glutathione S-transferase family protein [Microvirga puerhi]|uniref:Glutathione S-transferase family protein n=1 Tax=Microvirga puerhi TaxID=2876078 RepID=A0ABS7VMU9_9HYPH|nr:glutathione S-transferase family protein [Microvirga puerhi]MBZ6076342.1 glutathione S-transferase family protein [Microvirga puerhi]